MHAALRTKLEAALSSREKRSIRRRLPDPNLHVSASTTTTGGKTHIIDFNSNDYLSLSLSPVLRARFLQKLQNSPDILGSGGSRLLVNTPVHAAFEDRLARFFNSPTALLFNSGFDANVGFFTAIPQQGDAIVFDEHIHASVHDGMRSSRVDPFLQLSFGHNSLEDLRRVFVKLRQNHTKFREGKSSVFVSVESLYSMDGTFAPLVEISRLIEELYPLGNAYLVVDEAHSTGIYGPQGRGRVAMLGLEGKVLARLVTFGKALSATGAVILTNELVRDYLLNYARSLIYTTSLSFANVIAADASFDMLEEGTAGKLAEKLLNLSAYFIQNLRERLEQSRIPPSLLSLPSHLTDSSSSPVSSPISSSTYPSLDPASPSPIIPLLTSKPRPLSAYLLTQLNINARPITWPTVPKGKDRVRVCLHAGNEEWEIRKLVDGVIRWAEGVLREENAGGKEFGKARVVGGGNGDLAVASKL